MNDLCKDTKGGETKVSSSTKLSFSLSGQAEEDK